MAYTHFEGETLTQTLKRFTACRMQVPIPFIMNVAVSFCEVLQYSHSFFDSINDEFVPHGNLSPDFIHIGRNGNTTISDMGIGEIVKYIFDGSKLIENTSSAFMHPDIKCGKNWKRNHEIYSLGKILLHMLTDFSCFEGKKDGEIKNAKLIKNGRQIAENIQAQKILKPLISKDDISVHDVKEILNCFIKEKNIQFSKESTAQMVMIHSPQKPVLLIHGRKRHTELKRNVHVKPWMKQVNFL